MGKNAIVGQSGGPTSVINASLAGVFESCKSRGAEIVYGMCNGVAGLLEERVVDLFTVLTDDLDIELLKRMMTARQWKKFKNSYYFYRPIGWQNHVYVHHIYTKYPKHNWGHDKRRPRPECSYGRPGWPGGTHVTYGPGKPDKHHKHHKHDKKWKHDKKKWKHDRDWDDDDDDDDDDD